MDHATEYVRQAAASYRRRGIPVTDAEVEAAVSLAADWRARAYRDGITDADLRMVGALNDLAFDAVLMATRRRRDEERAAIAQGQRRARR
jgi:hypothetical protein